MAESRREEEDLDELGEGLGEAGEDALDEDHGLRGRISKAGEDAIGDVAQALLENPILNSALSTALGAGERAMQAQRSAMEALNLPAASDIERLERRLRAISDRVEEMEDRLDDMGADVAALRRQLSKGAAGPASSGGTGH